MISSKQAIKRCLSLALTSTGVDRAMIFGQRLRWGPAYVRLLNCHSVPRDWQDGFRRQLEYYAKHFVGTTPDMLAGLLDHGVWNADRPGLIICFDDGMRTQYDYALPLIEEFGFTGWFFIPVQFIETPPGEQVAYAGSHNVQLRSNDLYPDGRIFMTWDEIRSLLPKHVVGCHTRTHQRFTSDLSDERVHDEIVNSKADLERRLGAPVDSFCWVGGEEWTYSPAAAAKVREAGYRFAFMTASAPARRGTSRLHLHRTNIEADCPMDLTKMFVAGVGDLVHRRKRLRVDALTTPSPRP